MESGKRRAVTTCTSALLLALIAFTAVMPQAMERRETATPASSAAVAVEDGISRFKEDRQTTREEEMRQLQQIAQDESADDDIRGKAREEILRVTRWMEQEATIEGVLRARGYADCVATVHADSVNVLIRAETLTREESAVILELAVRETGQAGGNVKIIPVW